MLPWSGDNKSKKQATIAPENLNKDIKSYPYWQPKQTAKELTLEEIDEELSKELHRRAKLAQEQLKKV